MKSILIMCLIVTGSSLAQAPEKNFQEISPELEKKIELREMRRKEALKKRQDEERKKQEELKVAAEKKAAEEKRIAEEKRKKAEEDRIAAEKKAADDKKKAEVEAYTKWLISERDRKMRESHEVKPQAVPSPSVLIRGKTIKEESFTSEIVSGGKNSNSVAGNSKLVTVSASCKFQKSLSIPDDIKVFALGTYEGTPPNGPRGFRHHPTTDIRINLDTSGPVALVIWTYEPSRWIINKNGADVRAVFVIGYHKQSVEIDGDVPLLVSSYEQGDVCSYSDGMHFHNDDGAERARRRLGEFSQHFFKKDLSSFEYKYALPAEVSLRTR